MKGIFMNFSHVNKRYFIYKTIEVDTPIPHFYVECVNENGNEKKCFASPLGFYESKIQEGNYIFDIETELHTDMFINKCESCGENTLAVLNNYRLIEEKLNNTANSWVSTNDLQRIKYIGNGFYNCIEARSGNEGKIDSNVNCYILRQSMISINPYMINSRSYSEEDKNIINSFYESVEDFDREYKDINEKRQALAKMMFESTPYCACENSKNLETTKEEIGAVLDAYTSGKSFVDSCSLSCTDKIEKFSEDHEL